MGGSSQFDPYAMPSTFALSLLPHACESELSSCLLASTDRSLQVWGAVVTVMAEMQTYSHALVSRFFLAIIEAGFPPGVLYVMTTWYKKNEIGG